MIVAGTVRLRPQPEPSRHTLGAESGPAPVLGRCGPTGLPEPKCSSANSSFKYAAISAALFFEVPKAFVQAPKRRRELHHQLADSLVVPEVLDNITLYWLTNTGVSASRLYWEYKGGFFNAKGVSIPVAVTVFPSEQYEAPRSWAERAYPNLIHYNEVEKGGHFAAWEQPELFTSELRDAFRSLR